MPYKSKAQAAYFNANRDKLERQGVDVDQWNEESRDKQLPDKVKSGPEPSSEPDAAQVMEKMKTTPRRRRATKTASLAEVVQALVGRYKMAMAVLAGKQRLARTKQADSGQRSRVDRAIADMETPRLLDPRHVVPLIQTQPNLWEPVELPLQPAPRPLQVQRTPSPPANLAEALRRLLRLRQLQPAPPLVIPSAPPLTSPELIAPTAPALVSRIPRRRESLEE